MRRDMKKVWVAAGAVALALALGGGAWALGRASGAQGAPTEEELSASPRPDAGRAEVPEEPAPEPEAEPEPEPEPEEAAPEVDGIEGLDKLDGTGADPYELWRACAEWMESHGFDPEYTTLEVVRVDRDVQVHPGSSGVVAYLRVKGTSTYLDAVWENEAWRVSTLVDTVQGVNDSAPQRTETTTATPTSNAGAQTTQQAPAAVDVSSFPMVRNTQACAAYIPAACAEALPGQWETYLASAWPDRSQRRQEGENEYLDAATVTKEGTVWYFEIDLATDGSLTHKAGVAWDEVTGLFDFSEIVAM